MCVTQIVLHAKSWSRMRCYAFSQGKEKGGGAKGWKWSDDFSVEEPWPRAWKASIPAPGQKQSIISYVSMYKSPHFSKPVSSALK